MMALELASHLNLNERHQLLMRNCLKPYLPPPVRRREWSVQQPWETEPLIWTDEHPSMLGNIWSSRPNSCRKPEWRAGAKGFGQSPGHWSGLHQHWPGERDDPDWAMAPPAPVITKPIRMKWGRAALSIHLQASMEIPGRPIHIGGGTV